MAEKKNADKCKHPGCNCTVRKAASIAAIIARV
jgi:hypothetical protein